MGRLYLTLCYQPRFLSEPWRFSCYLLCIKTFATTASSTCESFVNPVAITIIVITSSPLHHHCYIVVITTFTTTS